MALNKIIKHEQNSYAKNLNRYSSEYVKIAKKLNQINFTKLISIY